MIYISGMRRLRLIAVAVIAAAAAGQPAGAQEDLAGRLARIGARVEEFYARARTVTSKETVHLQPLESGLSAAGPSRRLVYELRVAWDPSVDGGPPPEATVLRQLLTVNGRPPRPKDEPECMDPKDASPDALAMLLPQNRGDYEFKPAGHTRFEGRAAVMIDFRSISKEQPEVVWTDECVRVSLPGHTRGRLWIDVETHDVLRLDEGLTGMFDFPTAPKFARRGGPLHMVIERADSSIRYRAVKFENPEETVMLPRLIETTTVWRNAGVNRVRMTQQFSDYRRFVTDARILTGDEVR
jgi:hypothetical protein